jgi:two-component system chemotaxis response regulator CheB
MQERPRPILVVSGHGAKSDRAAEALAAGALEAIEKSTLRLHEPDDLWATALRSRIKRLASARPSPVPRPRLGPASGPLTAIGIAASTGGPQALATILATVPAGFTLPVLVVQHITAGFAPGLISWLDRLLALPVGVAEDGAPALPGVWFAPDDTHLGLDGQGRFALDAHTQRGAHRPSADMLFESLAAGAGETALGIVLTGMGRDGAQGVRALRAAGATVVAQDEESCAVFGMPRAAVEAGADRVLSLAEIAALLCGLRAGATV